MSKFKKGDIVRSTVSNHVYEVLDPDYGTCYWSSKEANRNKRTLRCKMLSSYQGWNEWGTWEVIEEDMILLWEDIISGGKSIDAIQKGEEKMQE